MYNVEQFDLSVLPENAQNELYDFYLLLKQRYAKTEITTQQNPIPPKIKIGTVFPRKLANIKPFTRDEIYE